MAVKSTEKATTTTKKTTTRKTAAKKEAPVTSVEVETTEVKEPVKKKAKPKRVFSETDGILCRSVTSGKLIMVGKKTGMKYEWGDYGREYEVEYRDLVIAVRTRSSFVFSPLFIIDDADFLEEFPIVKKFYDDSYNIDELDAIIDLPVDEMKQAIAALPPGATYNLKSLAAKAVVDKRLDSLEKIRLLDDLFGINLMLMSEG